MTQEVAEALRAIAVANGGKITPEMVVDAARDTSSPLHEHFTWDDEKAAGAFRLVEARALIRSVRVDIVMTTHTLKAPEFVRDPAMASDKQGYVSLGHLRTDEDVAREAVVAEFARAAAALSRARTIAIALGLSDEIDKVREHVVAFAGRFQETRADA